MKNTCKKNSSQVSIILYKPAPVSYTTTIDKKTYRCCMLGYPKAHTPKLTCLVLTYASTFYSTVCESASGQHVRDKLSGASAVLHHHLHVTY